MATDPNAETWVKVVTQFNVVRAQQNDLALQIRRGELLDQRKAEAVIFMFARRMRDQLLTAPARHAAILAAEWDLPPAALAHALGQLMTIILRDAPRHRASPETN